MKNTKEQVIAITDGLMSRTFITPEGATGITLPPAVIRQALINAFMPMAELFTKDEMSLNIQLGSVAELESQHAKFKHMSGTAYADKKDDLAKIYREIAEDFKSQAAARRADYNRHRDELSKLRNSEPVLQHPEVYKP